MKNKKQFFINQENLNTKPRTVKERDKGTNKRGEKELRTKEKFCSKKSECIHIFIFNIRK